MYCRSRDRDRRDRRHRDRSRSRSRERQPDRRDRRRRDRSRSRDRTRSRERDRRVSKDGTKTEERPVAVGNVQRDPKPNVWEVPIQSDSAIEEPKQSLLGNFIPNMTIEDAQRNLNVLNAAGILGGDRNGFQNQRGNGRESWPPNRPGFQRTDFQPLISEEGDDFNTRGQQRGGFNQNRNPNTFVPNNTFGKGPNGRLGLRNTETSPNCCVEMRGFYGAYSDVRRFFQGLFINNTGIKFVKNGIVYVRFAYPEGKEQALLKNGCPFRNSPIQVVHLDDEVFEQCLPTGGRGRNLQENMQIEDDNQQQSTFRGRNVQKHFNRNTVLPKVFNCLLIEDLPTFAKEQDILKMFSDYPLISILLINKARHHRVAYAKFSKAEDAKAALEETAKHVVEGKSVLVKPCSDEEFEAVEAEQNNIDIQRPDKSIKECNTDCVVLNNLPLKTNDRDISDFFSDIGIIPIKVHLMSNHLGFTGTVYCEFASVQEAAAALEKDRVPLGTNIISVKPIDRQEMQSHLGIPVPPQQQPINFPQMQQIHRPFFQRNNFGGVGIRQNFMGGPPRPPMRRFQKPHLGQHMQDPPGCTVLMENVPYKAGLDEILEFFDGFDIRTDNVLRRFNDNGTPSGEAKVYFNTPEEALQAVQQKRGHKIRDRAIYLTHC